MCIKFLPQLFSALWFLILYSIQISCKVRKALGVGGLLSNIGTPTESNIKHQTSVSSTLFTSIYPCSPFTALSGHVHAVNQERPSHGAEHWPKTVPTPQALPHSLALLSAARTNSCQNKPAPRRVRPKNDTWGQ